MSKQYLNKFVLLISIMAVLLAACGGGGEAEKMTIKLVENDWSASRVNVAVAKIILAEKMGYGVEIVALDETAQWTAIAAGDAHASLELWPSGHGASVEEFITKQKVVENGGSLGPIGKIGWYIPTYMVEQNPALATWEGFLDPANAALFATAETGDKGQFLASAPGFTQYDEDIINNLGMNLEVVFAGSEETTLAQLDAAYSRNDPILFYFWTPHSIHAKYDLTEVTLPPYSDECYAKIESNGVDCDYPADELFKIFWVELKEKAPDAYQMLKNMNYTTRDQIEMIADIELNGKTPEEAAQAWVDANEDVWKSWIPEAH